MSPEVARNRAAYDRMARDGHRLCRPATAAELADPMSVVDRWGWLDRDLRGRRVLCLAAGGGRHGPLYAAAGAEVTVADISPEMLRSDREEGQRHGLSIRTVETSMDDLADFTDGEFDVVIHPVSTCYVADPRPVFAEVARVTRAGGAYISQHKTPVSLQVAADADADGGYRVRTPLVPKHPAEPPTAGPNADRLREPGAVEFAHRWDEIVGGICRAGFVVEDLVHPDHTGDDDPAFARRARYFPPYVRIKARRGMESSHRLWVG